MVKRKLRCCVSCGGRHGPPTGKGCARKTEEKSVEVDEKSGADENKPELNDETKVGVESYEEMFAETNMDPESKEDYHVPFSSFRQVRQSPNYGEEDDFRQRWAGDSAAKERARHDVRATSKMAQSPEVFQGRIPAETLFEKRIADKVEHMENVLGRVAGVQQAQLQRLIDLMTVKDAKKKEEKADSAADTVNESASAKPTAVGVKDQATRWDLHCSDSSTEKMKPAEEEWREYHGEEMWQKEKDKKRKNPFDHQAYIKKGEEVDSFETLMVITFQTLKQLIDLKLDVKGLIRHGRSLAEKASKGNYKKSALIGYDESVRERAGEIGPSAFGVVEYDDVFRFFCADNTIPKKPLQGKQSPTTPRVKSEKICHRYNDAGCQSRTCIYAHKCASCELWGHPQKDCRRGEKKKEVK